MIDTKGLDEFRKAWDEAKESKEPKAADTGAVTDVDDFDYGDPVKDTAKAEEIKAAPVVENKTEDSDKSAVQTTPAVEPAKLSFKERFAQEYKRYKADPSSANTFDWNGKKILLKLKSEVGKNYAAQEKAMAANVPRRTPDAVQKAKATVEYKPEPAKVPVLTDAAPAVQMVTDSLAKQPAKQPDTKVAKAKQSSDEFSDEFNKDDAPKSNPALQGREVRKSHEQVSAELGIDPKTGMPVRKTTVAVAGKGNRVQ